MNMQKDWRSNLEDLLNKDETIFISNLAGLRSNRISVDFIGTIPVNNGEKKAKVSHLATLRPTSAKDLSVTVFAKKDIQVVTKSILDADLGYRVEKTVGEVIYFSLAPVTEEIRMRLIHKCKDSLENAKIAFRNSRQRALVEIKNSKLPTDQDKRAKKQVDEMVNLWGTKATKIYEQKVAELSKF